jgi:lipopolysaccharide transport system ATP-binding protein
MNAALSVSGVSKRYPRRSTGAARFRPAEEAELPSDEFWALKDITFEIYPGEIVGVIGRSGAGKSTLLKILSRLTPPTHGEITLRGRVAGLLEPGGGLQPDLSGRENIYLSGSLLGLSRAEVNVKFDEIVAFAQGENLIDEPVKSYSSGLSQRLAFSIPAHFKPEILIIDELTGIGDAQFQRECVRRLHDLSRSEGRTIMVVSHSMTAIRRLCRRCAVLESGRLLGVFPVEEAISRHALKASATELDLDTSDLQRARSPDGKIARIIRARVLSRAGLQFNEPFMIELALEVSEPVASVRVSFAMDTLEGQRVMTLDSDAEGKTLSLQPGRSIIRMSVERLPLSPGWYFGNVTVKGTVVLDILDNFAQWEVQRGHSAADADRDFGGCRLRPKIEFLGAEN